MTVKDDLAKLESRVTALESIVQGLVPKPDLAEVKEVVDTRLPYIDEIVSQREAEREAAKLAQKEALRKVKLI